VEARLAATADGDDDDMSTGRPEQLALILSEEGTALFETWFNEGAQKMHDAWTVEYEQAQAGVCVCVFVRALSVSTGARGLGPCFSAANTLPVSNHLPADYHPTSSLFCTLQPTLPREGQFNCAWRGPLPY
jgi:hypothetical protein